MGRRVAWHAYFHNGTDWPTSPSMTYYFLHDNWNTVLWWRDGAPNDTRKYTWGLDLSSSIHGAGGVGGILACSTSSADTWFFYDGNGNVTQQLSAADSSLAGYSEYDPYGNRIPTGTNYDLFGFSTKWMAPPPCQDAADLYYYGFRWYNTQLGRWANRDPMEEAGGLNLYGFVANDPIDGIDPLGLFFKWWDCVACGAAFGGKLGGIFGGCYLGCKSSDLPEGYSMGDCFSDCLEQHMSLCELWDHFKKHPQEWIGAAACVSCGVRGMKAIYEWRKDKSKARQCEEDDCDSNRGKGRICNPCKCATYIRVDGKLELEWEEEFYQIREYECKKKSWKILDEDGRVYMMRTCHCSRKRQFKHDDNLPDPGSLYYLNP